MGGTVLLQVRSMIRFEGRTSCWRATAARKPENWYGVAMIPEITAATFLALDVHTVDDSDSECRHDFDTSGPQESCQWA